MRVVIIAEDKTVGIDNEFYSDVDLTGIDPSIHAVQWYGSYGEIEYKTKYEKGSLVKPANLFIDDISAYKFAIDAWNQTKIEVRQKEEMKAAMEAAMLEAAAEANTYIPADGA